MLEQPFLQDKSSREAAVAGNTYRHGVVEGVVVDTGSQGEIQHAALKELQRLRHLLVEILGGFVGAGEVQVVRVQPVRGEKRASQGGVRW